MKLPLSDTFKKTPLSVLKAVFGYDTFRSLQEEIIQAVMDGHDVGVLMPTGGGKSLCYQVPALLKEGCTIVISPLISLMQDQVMSLRSLGVEAQFWNSSLTSKEAYDVCESFKKGEIKMLYVAPERLLLDDFLTMVKTVKIALLAIDEAHCISEWGHDFRPDYRKLHVLKELFPDIPIMALTATATERVLKDISTQLKLNEVKLFKASFNRDNLFYEIRPKKQTFRQLVDFIKERKGQSGIIYCQSRKQVDSVSEKLGLLGIPALPYHAGLGDTIRKENQTHFIHDKASIIVATIAFGMGINKPDVRFVIHYDLPKTIENYYQETGRAGRDGLDSHCLLFYSYGDKQKYEGFISQMSDEKERAHAIQQLNQMVRLAFQPLCRRKQLLQYFGERYEHDNCKRCDACTHPPEQQDVTVISQKILSCIYRIKERFGTNMVISVLKGESDPRIEQYSLDRLSVYGIEQELTKVHIRDVVQYLTYLGAIQVVGTEYPILKLTKTSMPILRGQHNVLMPIFKYGQGKKEREKKRKWSGTADYDRELFDVLRQKRKEMAEERGVPPYMIFHDRALQEIAALKPKSIDDFRIINGVGEQKMKTIVPEFLECLDA